MTGNAVWVIGLAGVPADLAQWAKWLPADLLSNPGFYGPVGAVSLWVTYDLLFRDGWIGRLGKERPPPLGDLWTPEDEVWARLAFTSLLVEDKHWRQQGFARERTVAGNERIRRIVDRFAHECPGAVRGSSGEREFNAEVLLWWVAKEVEAMDQ